MRGTLEIYRESNFWKDYEKAANQESDEVSILRLSSHSSASVRRQVAENKNTPIYILGSLLHDNSTQVKASLAKRTDLPEAYYWLLSTDENEAVRASVLANMAVPNSVVLALLNDSDSAIARLAKVVMDHRQRQLVRILAA